MDALFRANGGCTDSDNNAADFSANTLEPMNGATMALVCACP
jgi:hypothetical protein